MRAARILLALSLLLVGAAAAHAQSERILDFVSDVGLRPDASLDVTETITFQVMGIQLRHGINRDFPTDYGGLWGLHSTTGFALREVLLDGEPVPRQLSRLQNGIRIKIGDPSRLVSQGIHTYTIHYLTWWQVSFRPAAVDRLDWNVTGNGWTWPIDRAELRLHGPQELVWRGVRAFTGPAGSRAEDARIIRQAPGFLDVATTRPLSLHEGLTVAASFPKGVLRQPSGEEAADHWLADNLPVLVSFLGLASLGIYTAWLFGYGATRPPAAIIPLFAPPAGFSPAMVGFLEDKRFSDRDFSAGVIGLAVARRLRLVHGDEGYQMVRQQGGQPVTGLEEQFESVLFAAGDELSISARNQVRLAFIRTALNNLLRHVLMPALLYKAPQNVWPALALAAATVVLTMAALTLQLGSFAAALGFAVVFAVIGSLIVMLSAKTRGPSRWGTAFVGLVFLATGLGIARQGGSWLLLVALFLIGAAVLAAASFRRLVVPTAEGWKRRDEIEGLKLFLGVAEAERLRVLNPPDFTPALYEKLLPYAIALGVEMAWSRRFAAALAASQATYQPDWYDESHPWSRSDTAAFASDLGGGLSAAIAAASSPPSSSDGSDGAGSGGGGGGGGGSGW